MNVSCPKSIFRAACCPPYLAHVLKIERIDLWPFIEEAKSAEDAAFQADQKYLIELERISHNYGKDEHEKLRQLVLAHVQQTGTPLKTNAPDQTQKQ